MIVKLYSHTDDDDIEDDVESWAEAGVPPELAEELIGSRPLYEVTHYFDVDVEARSMELVAIDLGGGRRAVGRNVT